jgi:hypothetical protein
LIKKRWRKDREVLTTSGTYPWWFVTQIFRSGQPSHGGEGKTFEAMTSSGISNQLRYIYPYACAAGMLLHINGKFTMGKLKSSLFASWKINFFFLSNELSWVYSNVNLPFLPPDIYIHCLDYFAFATMTWLTATEYLCHKSPWICSTCRKHFPVLSSFMTGFVTRLTRWMVLVEQELLTLPEHLSSSPIFSDVGVTRSLVLCVCFVDRCLSFCPFSFAFEDKQKKKTQHRKLCA